MLSGARILVVEHEALIAMDVQRQLEGAGAGQVTICSSVAQASEMRSLWAGFDLAIVEGRLGAPAVLDLVASLEATGVPVVVTSADRGTAALFSAAFVEKPFDDSALIAACLAAINGDGEPNPA